MSFEFTSIYCDDNIVRERIVDVFTPEKVTKDKAIFFIHGGGWHAGSRLDYHTTMKKFCEAGYVCGTADYRLTTKDNDITIFDQITDVRHGYDSFVSFLKRINRPLKTVVIGSSAGAHLTQLLCFADPGECDESLSFNGREMENDWIRPVGCVPCFAPSTFIPWQDINTVIWSQMCSVAGCSYEENPEVFRKISPDTYLDKIKMPTFFPCSVYEKTFPVKMIEEFSAKILARGVQSQTKVYDDVHGCLYGVSTEIQRDAYAAIERFIEML